MSPTAAAAPCHPVHETVRIAPAPAWRFSAVPAGGADEVRNFIRKAFHDAYGAHITQFLPHLHALTRDGELLAACGLRYAATQPLFLERYLGRDVEGALSDALHETVPRDGVVEVGNLSIARPGLGRRFIVHLTDALHDAGMA